MRRIARIQCVGLLLTVLWCVVVAATADIDPIETVTLPDSTFNAIAKLPSGGYLLGGAVPTGSQPWETRPGITVYGSTNDAPIYNIDGIDIAQGAAVSFDQVEEMELMTGGFRAEYGGPGFSAAVLDYEAGGTAVVQVVTKSGTNKFVGLRFTYVNESLNSLTYGEDGSLWGAGTVFAPDPVPVLGFFDESGGFTQVENPLTALGGFLNGIEFMGIGVGYGYTMPDGAPTRPLLTYSYNYGVTWEAPPNLPWVFGTVNTLQPVDTYLWWLGGETPSGAGFAHTADGGATWMSQMMPDATYIWDLDIAMLPIEPSSCDETKILGAALGTYYVDEYTKESIVYRTLDGKTWEEMWRVPGYGGDLFFDYLGDGEIGIVQNGLDGTATFSRYAAHDFFGGTNIICDMEISQGADTTYPDEPLTLQLDLRGPWGEPIVVDTVEWSTDWGELVVDPNDPLVATFTAAAPGEAKVMCTEPASGWSTSAVISVQLSIE